MAQCEICGTELIQGRGRARRTCSAACRQAAHRRRQAEQLAALRAAAAQPAPTVAPPTPTETPPPDDSPAGRIRAAGVELLAAVEAAVRRAAQQWDTDADTGPQESAHTVRSLADQVTAAILASAPEASRNELERPTAATAAAVPAALSRNEPAAAATRKKSPPASARPAKPSRDDPKTEPAPVATGIEPRPQKLARKKAAAIVDAAELVHHPEYRDNHRWILRSGETVLGYVEPTYGGASQSGRNGWTGRLGGMPGPRCRSRDGAASDLAMRWVQLVTTAPKRSLTGG